MANALKVSAMQDRMEFDQAEIDRGSIVGRARALNLAACFVLEKRISLFTPDIGFDAPDRASRAGATYFNVDSVQGRYDGRYFDRLSDLSKMIPAGVTDITVQSLSVSIKMIRGGVLSEKMDHTYASVPFVVARENSANPVLVRNEQFDQQSYVGLTAKALKDAVNLKTRTVGFSAAGTGVNHAPSAKYDMVLDNLIVKVGAENVPAINLGGIRVHLDNFGRFESLEVNNASRVVDIDALPDNGIQVEMENEDLLTPLPQAAR